MDRRLFKIILVFRVQQSVPWQRGENLEGYSWQDVFIGCFIFGKSTCVMVTDAMRPLPCIPFLKCWRAWSSQHAQYSVHTPTKSRLERFFMSSWGIALPFSKFLHVSWMEFLEVFKVLERMEFLKVFKVLEIVNNTAQGLREWTRWSNRLFPSLISVSLWFKDFLHLLAAASLGHFIPWVVILPIMGNGRGFMNPPVAIETQQHLAASTLTLPYQPPWEAEIQPLKFNQFDVKF